VISSTPLNTGAEQAPAEDAVRADRSGIWWFLKRLLTRKTSNGIVQLFRYGIVGGLAFIVDYGTYSLLNLLGVNYLISGAISFTLGLIVNYLLSIRWVFTHSSRRATEVIIFTLIGVAGLGINELILYVCTGLLGISPAVSKLISTAIVFLWNFILRRAMFLVLQQLDRRRLDS
jgi:putative flippase GtrA